MLIGKTMSVCPVCLAKIPAQKAVGEDGNIYMEKRCWEHGSFRTLIWEGDLESYVNWAANDVGRYGDPRSGATGGKRLPL